MKEVLKIYRDHILEIDSSIVFEFYENDEIFIIAIDDDKYESYNKQFNKIGYDIHEKYGPEKDILVMPKRLVSAWDKPLEIID